MPNTNERLLLPVLARVIDLGQGPPGLVSWVQHQLTNWNVPTSDTEAAVLRRLACELLRVLPSSEREVRSDERDCQTVCINPLETVLGG